MKYFSLVFGSLFIISCQQDFEFEIDPGPSKLVVNSIFNPNDNWSLELFKTKSILDTETENLGIANAEVKVKELLTGDFHFLIDQGDGLYTHPSKPNILASYELSIKADGFEDLTARDIIPSKIKVHRIDTQYVIISGNPALKVDFEFEDTKDEDNFYIWDLVLENRANTSLETMVSKRDFFTSNIGAYLGTTDVNIDKISKDQFRLQSKLFISDDKFKGQDYSTSFYTFQDEILINRINKYEGENAPTGNPDLQIKLRIVTVSKNLFEFTKSMELYKRSIKDTSIAVPFEVYSNVANGYGIFGAYKQTLISI